MVVPEKSGKFSYFYYIVGKLTGHIVAFASSLLGERDSEDESPFHKLHRHTSIGRESENDDPPRFAMHRLRTTRPLKKMTQNPNDSGSSGEDDDEDGFEILTAENLFSTLLSRVSFFL